MLARRSGQFRPRSAWRLSDTAQCLGIMPNRIKSACKAKPRHAYYLSIKRRPDPCQAPSI